MSIIAVEMRQSSSIFGHGSQLAGETACPTDTVHRALHADLFSENVETPVSGLPLCGAGWQGYPLGPANWQSARRQHRKTRPNGPM